MKSPQAVHWLQRFAGHVPNLQPRVGKWPMILVVAVYFPSCAPPPEFGVNPGTLPWRGIESDAYRMGHKDGSRDQRAGRPDKPQPAKAVGRNDYLLGYQDGYRHPHDNPWSQHRAHELGHQQGLRDKHAGRAPDPEHHAMTVPRSVRGHFREGYRMGYQ